MTEQRTPQPDGAYRPDAPVSSETMVLRPDFGWYRLQARTDDPKPFPEFEGEDQNPVAYADDEGGIWLQAMAQYGPAEVTLEVLPVDAQPEARPGSKVVYDGQFYVEEVDADTGVIVSPQGDFFAIPTPVTWATRLDWGTWRCVIQVEGHETASPTDQQWHQEYGYGEEQPPVERWWVSLIDTA
jgi:hypothetical protein